MGHLNVLKGAYPSLIQLDETAPVAPAVTDIVRGSVLVKNAQNEWALCAASHAGGVDEPGAVPYFALQAQGDPDVKMAGALTALNGRMPCEMEIDQYDDTVAIAVGDYLALGTAGKLVKHATGETAVGICSKAATSRWSNSAPRTGMYPDDATGSRIAVIAFWTCYIPNLVIA